MSPGSAPVGLAIVGAGTISRQYLDNLTAFPDVRVVSVGDLDTDRAAAVAAAYGVPHSGTAADAVGHPDAEIVVNLTVPAAHTGVARRALAAGKHVYGEKPFALDRRDGAALLEEARGRGLRLGSAPDTFLGAGIQTALRAVRSGAIGRPLFAMAAMQNPGPESWHPNPAFLFQRGAGPLWDIGPYYLTLLVALFGPAERVAAVGRRSREQRTVGSGPLAGTVFDVEVPTHVSATVEFASGQVASVVLSFDSQLRRAGLVEIGGTEAALKVPDPNTFGGEVGLRRAGEDAWTLRPASGSAHGRGTGVLEMARAIREDRPHRASAELALHVVGLMEAVGESAETGAFVSVPGGCAVPEPLPDGWSPATAVVSGRGRRDRD